MARLKTDEYERTRREVTQRLRWRLAFRAHTLLLTVGLLLLGLAMANPGDVQLVGVLWVFVWGLHALAYGAFYLARVLPHSIEAETAQLLARGRRKSHDEADWAHLQDGGEDDALLYTEDEQQELSRS